MNKIKKINATIACKNWSIHGCVHYKDFLRADALIKFLNEHDYPYKVEKIADIHIGKWYQGLREYELYFNPEY